MKAITKRVVLRGVCFLALVLFMISVSAQENHRKIYSARYKVKYKLKRLDSNGRVITQSDNLYLQKEEGEVEELIQNLASSKRGLTSNVEFGEGEESNKLFVNPFWVVEDSEGSNIEKDAIYYYELHNRQSVDLSFQNFSVKVLYVPVRVRIGEDESEFSSEANLGAFAGYSWGKTKFTHREKVGNTEVETLRTFGILLGTEKLEFEFQNENDETEEVETAVISTGLGFTWTYEKFTAGITGGFDFALGEDSDEWDYHARPWIGLAIGFSLLSFE